jgi:hypothetical protein
VFGDQGDQIGRIVANWAIVYFVQFFIYTSIQIFELLLSKIFLVLTSYGLGYILGDFFHKLI